MRCGIYWSIDVGLLIRRLLVILKGWGEGVFGYVVSIGLGWKLFLRMVGVDCFWIEGWLKGVWMGEVSVRECEDVGDGDEKGWWFSDCVERVCLMKEEEVGNDGVRLGVIYFD